MDGPLLDAANIVGLLAIVGFFFFMLRHRRPPGPSRPERDLAYEWVAEPADRASPGLLAKFGGDVPRGPGVTLIRLGFFNAGSTAIAADETIRPLAVLFADDTEFLLADFAESLKNDGLSPPAPVLGAGRVEFPPFDLASGGVAIFNLAIRGASRPRGLEGAIHGIERIRRLG